MRPNELGGYTLDTGEVLAAQWAVANFSPANAAMVQEASLRWDNDTSQYELVMDTQAANTVPDAVQQALAVRAMPRSARMAAEDMMVEAGRMESTWRSRMRRMDKRIVSIVDEAANYN